MDQTVQVVEQLEHQALRAAGSGGKDRAAFVRGETGQQRRHVCRGIFAVSVHDDDGRTRDVLRDPAEAGGQRPLVPQVAAEIDYLHACDHL